MGQSRKRIDSASVSRIQLLSKGSDSRDSGWRLLHISHPIKNAQPCDTECNLSPGDDFTSRAKNKSLI